MSRKTTAFDTDERATGTLANTIVTDEEGRRRFHGAFTGGFSAGYYNTVGSEKGWTPSQFVSSRNKEASNFPQQQRPEDFMDEDDDPLLGKTLHTKQDYNSLGGNKNNKRQVEEGASIPGNVFEDLIIPTQGVGKRLLQLMGWREGQGVGPRVEREKKLGGIPMGGILFAPKNVEIKKAQVKNDNFGLGYDITKEAPELSMYRDRGRGRNESGNKRLLLGDVVKGSTTYGSTNFGISALEEADDDDVYTTEGRKTDIYDTVLGGPDPFAEQLKYNQSHGITTLLTSGKEKKGMDNRQALRGFIIADKSITRKNEFPPPAVPRDFIPKHKFASPLSDVILTKAKNAANRAAMLGENPLAEKLIERSRLLKEKEALTASQALPSGAMASRFEPAVKLEENIVGQGGLMNKEEIKKLYSSNNSEGGLMTKIEVKLKDAVREEQIWLPVPLLCKRFNVKDPHKDSNLPLTTKSQTSQAVIPASFGDNKKSDPKAQVAEYIPPIKDVQAETTQHDPSVDTTDKPSIDLFKAIFDDDF